MSTKRELIWSLIVILVLVTMWVVLILFDYIRRPT